MRIRILLGMLTLTLAFPALADEKPAMKKNSAIAVTQAPLKSTSAIPGVIKMPIAKGVKIEEAVESMKLRANYHNMKLVAELPLSKQVEAILNKPQRFMTIYQFCDALTAKQMVESSIEFAAFLPCRIAVVEDAQSQGWLVMTDLNPLINIGNLNPQLKKRAMEVRDQLESIMKAGANGEL